MGTGHGHHGIDHHADQGGGRKRGEQPYSQAEATEEFGQTPHQGEDLSRVISKGCEPFTGFRQAHTPENPEQLLSPVVSHQQSEGQPDQQQPPIVCG